MRNAALSTARKGAAGEALAAAYLEGEGWTVRDRNVRTAAGEIDLVVTRADVIAFVEVKAWRTLPQEALAQSVNGRKRSRIVRAARLYLRGVPRGEERRPRCDVVFVSGPEHRIVHLEDAFNGEGID
jgi:putative endonuclease